MKTIDEVIKAMEYCTGFDFVRCQDCPGYSEPDCGIQDDALHYLKTIETTENLYHDAVNELSKWKDEDWKDRCLPLTWDELKQMIDSIVWLEWSSNGNWAEIIHATDDEIEYFRFGTDELCYIMRKDYVSDKWQAYRKERK